MRLGGPVTSKYGNPDEWISALKKSGYRAAYCPVDNKTDETTINDYVKVAKREDIIIAEVGVWNNPLSFDKKEREAAILFNQKQLGLAERIGAQCCVNISGSRGMKWDGPDPDNYSEDTFDMIVDTVRTIIDAVKPEGTFYTLEPMPWAFPDSADSYLKLISAIDREAFAVHMDIVNMINSPVRYMKNAEFIEDCFQKLGPFIKSVHLKDITLADNLTVHLNEAIPGQGGLNYRILLKEINKLNVDMPVMLEHLETGEEYEQAAGFVRKIVRELNIII